MKHKHKRKNKNKNKDKNRNKNNKWYINREEDEKGDAPLRRSKYRHFL